MDLLELAEDPFLLLGRDADPRVLDVELELGLPHRRADSHPAFLGRELERVGDQVEQQLPDQPGVRPEAQARLRLVDQLDPLVERHSPHRVEHLGDGVAEVHGLQDHLHPPRLDLGQVEDVVDQAEQVLAAAVDRLQELLSCQRVEAAVAVVDQQLAEAEDGVQRCAQLVAHVGQELALDAARVLELEVGLLKAGEELADVHAGGKAGDDDARQLRLGR